MVLNKPASCVSCKKRKERLLSAGCKKGTRAPEINRERERVKERESVWLF